MVSWLKQLILWLDKNNSFHEYQLSNYVFEVLCWTPGIKLTNKPDVSWTSLFLNIGYHLCLWKKFHISKGHSCHMPLFQPAKAFKSVSQINGLLNTEATPYSTQRPHFSKCFVIDFTMGSHLGLCLDPRFG